jgi:hypothetical protein
VVGQGSLEQLKPPKIGPVLRDSQVRGGTSTPKMSFTQSPGPIFGDTRFLSHFVQVNYYYHHI